MNAMDLFRLDGKTALVTGCKRGIGKAMAVALAEAGANIVGVSKTLEPSDSLVEQEVRSVGRNFKAYQCDLSSRSAVYELIRVLHSECPDLDILVNNAGIILRAPAAEHTDEYWDEVIQTNLTAQFLLSREIGRRMVDRKSGKIIFTTSLLAFQGGINVPSYAAAKGGLAQLTKAFANEWAPFGVQVNAIAPGYVATDNTEALRANSERSAAILSRIPAARWGQPEDFKGAVVFLASRASEYVNGAILVVDGGWMGR